MHQLDKVKTLTSTLEGFDVLRALGQLGDGLHESDTGLLVGLEWGKHCTGHFDSVVSELIESLILE